VLVVPMFSVECVVGPLHQTSSLGPLTSIPSSAEMTVISSVNKESTLKSFDTESISDYSLDEIKGVFVAPETALLTYKLHIKTSLAGKPHEGDFFVSSLWVKRGGVWKNVLYQETPAK
jgi:hypothetical protein